MKTKKLTPIGCPELAGKLIRIKKDHNGKSLYILDNGGRYLKEELEEYK